MRFHLEPDYSDTNGREGYKPVAKLGKELQWCLLQLYIQLIVYHCIFMLGFLEEGTLQQSHSNEGVGQWNATDTIDKSTLMIWK